MINFVPSRSSRFSTISPDSVLHTIVKCKKISTVWKCAFSVAQILTDINDINFDHITITNFDGIGGSDFESADMVTYCKLLPILTYYILLLTLYTCVITKVSRSVLLSFV